MDSFNAIPQDHNMMALLEFDVTDSRKALKKQRRNGKRVSMFAFVIKLIAMALAENDRRKKPMPSVAKVFIPIGFDPTTAKHGLFAETVRLHDRRNQTR